MTPKITNFSAEEPARRLVLEAASVSQLFTPTALIRTSLFASIQLDAVELSMVHA